MTKMVSDGPEEKVCEIADANEDVGDFVEDDKDSPVLYGDSDALCVVHKDNI